MNMNEQICSSYRQIPKKDSQSGPRITLDSNKASVLKKQDDIFGLSSILEKSEMEKGTINVGEELSNVIYPKIFEEAKPEFSFLMPPTMDYYPFNILYRDVSEIPLDDNINDVQSNLKQIWKVGGIPERNRKCPNMIFKRSQYFTSLSGIHLSLLDICKTTNWKKSTAMKQIYQHILKMARELYIALRDSEAVADSTLYLRENQIIDDCLDASQHKESFDFFSAKKIIKEVYVDLRRGIALVATICQIDANIGISILRKSRYFIDCNCKTFSRNLLTNLHSFQLPEIKYITDSFINEPGRVSTFNHSMASSSHTLSVPGKKQIEVLRRKIKQQMQSLSKGTKKSMRNQGDIVKEKYLIDLSTELISKVQKDDHRTSPIKPSNSLFHPSIFTDPIFWQTFDNSKQKKIKSFSVYLCDEINNIWDNQNFKRVENDQNIHEIKKPQSSLLSTMLETEHNKWVKAVSTEITKESPSTSKKSLELVSATGCNSLEEKELLCSTFHNFLKIKNNIEGKETVCSCHGANKLQSLQLSRSLGKDSNKKILDDILNRKKKNKRKYSTDISESSSSRDSDSKFDFIFTRKHDIAPLKKIRYDEPLPTGACLQETDHQFIETEIEKIYQEQNRSRIGGTTNREKKSEGFPAKKNKVQISTYGEKMDKEDMEKGKSETKENIFEPKHILKRGTTLDSGVKPVNQNSKDELVNVSPEIIASDYLPEDIASKCELLDIMHEIVRQISLMRYTALFNPLLAALIQLLHSLLTYGLPGDILRLDKIFSVLLETLYCRPSPTVLISINLLLADVIHINGFPQRLCHNAHPNKFKRTSDGIQIRRGCCFLSTVCSLVDFTSQNETWEMQFYFIRWLSFLFLVERNTILFLYGNQRTTSGRCDCILCLNNTIITILSNSALKYHKCCTEKKLTPLLNQRLCEIIENGIRILSVIVEIDRYFAQNIELQYSSYVMFLEIIKFLHLDCNYNLHLRESDFAVVTLLLDEEAMARKYKRRHIREETNLDTLAELFKDVTFLGALESSEECSEFSKPHQDTD